jgi:hypothetical protein
LYTTVGVVLGVAEGTVVVVLGAGGVVGVLVVGSAVVGFPDVGVVGLAVVGVLGLAVVGVLADGALDWVALELGVKPSGLVRFGDGATHGGAGVLEVAVGLDDGNHGVTGRSGFPTGSDALILERDVPCDRSACELNELVDCGAWVVVESGVPNGTKNQTPASATTTVVRTPNFRTDRPRRLCRAPNWRACRPRWNCLTSYPFTPRPSGSLHSCLRSTVTVGLVYDL